MRQQRVVVESGGGEMCGGGVEGGQLYQACWVDTVPPGGRQLPTPTAGSYPCFPGLQL